MDEKVYNELIALRKRFDNWNIDCNRHKEQTTKNASDIDWLKRFFWLAILAVTAQVVSNISLALMLTNG